MEFAKYNSCQYFLTIISHVEYSWMKQRADDFYMYYCNGTGIYVTLDCGIVVWILCNKDTILHCDMDTIITLL